jgi:hypothetical protein
MLNPQWSYSLAMFLVVTSLTSSVIATDKSHISSIVMINNVAINTRMQKQINKNGQLIAQQQPQPQSESFVQWVKTIFQGKKTKGATNGEFCSISPYSIGHQTRSPHPLFVWQGKVSRLEVISLESGAFTWEYALTSEENQRQMIRYAGATLNPGEKYEIRFIDGGKRLDAKTFNIITNQKKQEVDQKIDGIRESQNLHQERLRIFDEEDLFMDFVEEIFIDDSHSSEIREEFCR